MWLYYVLMGCGSAFILICFYYFFIRPYSYRWKPCYGTRAYGVCLPSSFQVHGFDISHHQGDIDWDALQQTQHTPFPIRFVFMKASEGAISAILLLHAISTLPVGMVLSAGRIISIILIPTLLVRPISLSVLLSWRRAICRLCSMLNV